MDAAVLAFPLEYAFRTLDSRGSWGLQCLDETGVEMVEFAVDAPGFRGQAVSEIRKNSLADEAESNATLIPVAFWTLALETRTLDLFGRYETRFNREFCRAVKQFEELRASRGAKAI